MLCRFVVSILSLHILAAAYAFSFMAEYAKLPADVTPSNRRAALMHLGKLGLGASLLVAAPAAAIGNDVSGSTSGDDDVPSLYLAQPTGPSSKSGDSDPSKPSAPIEYLLPASRVKLYVDAAVTAAEEAAARPDDAVALRQVDDLLRSPPAFVRPIDPGRRVDDEAPGLLGQIELARRKQKERESLSIDVGLAPRAFEVLELSGERRQWDRLQRQEQRREKESEVRRAFNIYTSNLLFGSERYNFKGSREEKKRLVRSDRMPTVTSVIRSDLDLRDLYRNQVQTALEDAWAEYTFQVKQLSQQKGEYDLTELLGLLRDAQEACRKWFSFIPDEDVKVALEVVRNESI